jgi:predicted HicB family RNase H-like nuclease
MVMEKKKKVGRPRLLRAKRRSRKVFFRVTEAEYKALVATASRAGKPVSEFVSEIVNQTTRKSG